MRKLEFFAFFAASVLFCTLFGLMTSAWILPVGGLFVISYGVIAFDAARPERKNFSKMSAASLAFMLGAVPGGFAAQAADAHVINGLKKSAEELIPKVEAHRARTGKYPDSIQMGGDVTYTRDEDEFTLTVWRTGMFLDKWEWSSDTRQWVEN